MTENSQTRTARRKQKKAKKKPVWKKILLITFIVFMIAFIGAGSVAAYWIMTAPEIDEAMLKDPYASVLLDKDGEPFADLKEEGANRKKVEYEDLPQVLIDAVIATEDARFFEHPGIDLRRIGAAIMANISDGFGSQGASTITQQVVEKSFLSPEKEIRLKVQEQWLALKLERQYSKEEILEMYLNKIFYGANAYGVAQAAINYFGKDDLHDLTLPEAAILAGLPQRPTAYNPFQNPDLTKERMDTVLKLMVRHGKITEAEANEAREVDIESLLVERQPNSLKYGSFIDQVEKEVREKLDGADIRTDGLIIHTTLDKDAQEYVEFLLTDSPENPITYPNGMPNMQAAMVVLDTKTGAIQAIGGRRNPENYGEFNYAISDGSQLGSTAKPIMSYGPAIEYNKISTYHQINDDKPYEPAGSAPIRNWNRAYAGWVSARHALAQSLNVPTVKLAEEVGLDKAQEFSEKLGIKFHNDQMDIRDVIGGSSTNVNTLQLAGAYRAFGNEGIYNEPYAVTKVEFPDGKVVDLTPEPEAVMSDYTAYMVTDMLKTVVQRGTGTGANIPGLPVAGKTGTTNLEEGGSPDAWFAGYTTRYTIAAWSGGFVEDDDGKLKRAALPDTKISQKLFKHTMTKISEGVDTPDFVKPDSVVEAKVEVGSNPPAKPSANTPSSKIVTELFVKGTEPTSVSQTFDKLPAVSDLTAHYNEENKSIEVSWNYSSDHEVMFGVSISENGQEMRELTTTEDTSLVINEVEPGDYQIQVIAISKEDESYQSDPVTVKVTIKDQTEGELKPVENLSANYIEDREIINVSWSYNGPPALFEVTVNGQTHSNQVSANGIEIGNSTPGETYTIQVTPIGQSGENEGVRGEPRSIKFTVPAPKQEEPPQGQPNEEEKEKKPDQEQQPEEPDQNGEGEDEGEDEEVNSDGEDEESEENNENNENNEA